MVAVNPVNFGKAYKLSCAEAFAACLFLGGFEKEARFIMDHFKWGEHFFKVNEELFLKYKGITSQDKLKEIQEKYINDELERKQKRKEGDGFEDINQIDKESDNNSEKEEEENSEENKEEEEEVIDYELFKNIKIDDNDFKK